MLRIAARSGVRALPRQLHRPMAAMHDDFKPKTKSYAGDAEGDVHAQVCGSGSGHCGAA